MRLVSLLLNIVMCATLASPLLAQSKPVAQKIAEIPNAQGSTKTFVETMDLFLKRLSKIEKSTSGFIAISGDDYSTRAERERIVKEKILQYPKLKNRIEITRSGLIYNKTWSVSEFWLVPRGADQPYFAEIHDCSCPTIAIHGPDLLAPQRPSLTYTASVAGGSQESVTYRWKVVGGRIIGGQGSPSIQVRPNNRSVKNLMVTVKIGGIDEDCHCMDNDSITTQLQIK